MSQRSVASTSKPRTELWTIDGAPTGYTEGEPIPVRVGDHKIEMTNDRGTRLRTSNTPAGLVTAVQWDEPQPPDSVSPPPVAPTLKTGPVPAPPSLEQTSFWGLRSGVGFAALGIALVGVGVGVGYAVDHGNQTSSVMRLGSQTPPGKGACATKGVPACADYGAALQNRNDDATLSTLFFVSGGVVALAGAALVIWAAVHPDKKPSAFTPLLGSALGGQLVTTF